MGIYERQRTGKFIFLILSIAAIIIFLIMSNNLVKELAKQERERMNIWASATERLANAEINTDIEFLLGIISENNSIPVMRVDEDLNIVEFRIFNLQDTHDDPASPIETLSDKNRKFLADRLHKGLGNSSPSDLANNESHIIKVRIYSDNYQYIYYEDSILLRRLSLYPYVQLCVMVVLVIIIYFAVVYTKRAEQNRVWVGLSKETAHQLGTPISSLMAWSDYLSATGADPEITSEINKDVQRLSTIASRFSKIGSQPEVQLEYLNDVVGSSLDYMKNRISGKVDLNMHLSEDDHGVRLSRPLFEWVMENLTKNAVDAMEGIGKIDITTGVDHNKVFIEIKDTGKGIPRKNFKTIFNPGFTTKKRGWGLGLTLVKRIIEEYHGGKIFVKESNIGQGTTFRIELPKIS